MKQKALIALLFFSSAFLSVFSQSGRTENLFDSDWRFFRGDVKGAEKATFNDKTWKQIDLPHDWSVEKLDNQQPGKVIGPFSKESPGTTSTGYVLGGIGWYRKTFTQSAENKGAITILNFDGVYMDCEIWVNGKQGGKHPYGYTAFNVDVTKLLNAPGKPNVIAVKVKNEGKNSRWYSGSGIYRHVTVINLQPIHIVPWGVFVSTSNADNNQASIRIVTNVENSSALASDVKLNTRIVDANGKVVASNESPSRSLAARNVEISQNITVKSPALWSLETPNLYTVEVEVIANGKSSDKVTIPFGIRTINFDPQTGFTLNGKNVELKGGCMHHDNGFLGSATIDRAEERRVELMKAYGFNAIRTSHNPPSRQFLDACDRLGVVVIDEAFDMWERPKNPMDYSRFFKEWWQKDIESMVTRDRNHPSVVFWSIGNEINERADSAGYIITRKLADEVRRLDPTRPVTEAICNFWDHPGKEWSTTAPAFAVLDVGGYNYLWAKYETDHATFPKRLMMGTESTAIEAYDNWNQVEKHPYVIGDFIWTAMDYMGETGIGNSRLNDDPDSAFSKPWPWYNAYCGDIDICGFKKPQLLYRDVIWNNSNIEIAVHEPIPAGKFEKTSYWGWPNETQSWTWSGNEGKEMDVRVFTRYPAVRLELNGKIIAEKWLTDTSKYIVTFKVPYQPGILKAVGLVNGIEVASKQLATVGAPAKIKLTADRNVIKADRNDLSYVKVEITDAYGNLVDNTNLPVKFTVSGEGEIAGSGNACPFDMESFNAPVCKTFHGKALAILRPLKGNKAGIIKLKAESEGLTSAEIEVSVK